MEDTPFLGDREKQYYSEIEKTVTSAGFKALTDKLTAEVERLEKTTLYHCEGIEELYTARGKVLALREFLALPTYFEAEREALVSERKFEHEQSEVGYHEDLNV